MIAWLIEDAQGAVLDLVLGVTGADQAVRCSGHDPASFVGVAQPGDLHRAPSGWLHVEPMGGAVSYPRPKPEPCPHCGPRSRVTIERPFPFVVSCCECSDERCTVEPGVSQDRDGAVLEWNANVREYQENRP